MKLYLSFLSISLCLLCGCSDRSPEHFAKQGGDAFNEKRYAEAFVCYERLIQLSGFTPEAGYNLALSAYHAEDYDTAYETLDQVLAARPDFFEAQDLKVLILCADRQLREVFKLLTSLLDSTKDASDRAWIRSRMATCYVNQNRYSAAHAILLLTLRELPMDPITLYNLGMLYMNHLNQYPQAADYFALVERLAPKESELLKNAQENRSKLRAAISRMVKKTTSGDAHLAKEACDRAITALRKRELATAEREYQAACIADPTNFDAANSLGKVYVVQGKQAEALEVYKDALEIRPDKTDTAYRAAEIANRLRKYDEAEQLLCGAIATTPASPRQADLMVRILASQRKFTDAKLWGEYYLTLATQANAARGAYQEWVDSLPSE